VVAILDPLNIGLVGIGKLGTAMMTHWDKHNIRMGIYHPSEIKTQHFVEQFPNSFSLTEGALSKVEVLILALPAKTVIPFLDNLLKSSLDSHKPSFIINMATALNTKEIKAQYPDLNVIGLKYMGHSRDLMEHGNGLFITEGSLPKEIAKLFQFLGKIKIDSENGLIEVNKLATSLAIKAAIDIEREFAKRGLPPEYINRALTSLAPEVIRGYCEGSLGHFAQEIVREIKGENQ
jgi:hypothetical protein